jgi:hypothetical protein
MGILPKEKRRPCLGEFTSGNQRRDLEGIAEAAPHTAIV